MKAITDIVAKYEPELNAINAQLDVLYDKGNANKTERDHLNEVRGTLTVYIHNAAGRPATSLMEIAVAKLRWTLIHNAIKELDEQGVAIEIEAETLKKRREESSRCFSVELDTAMKNITGLLDSDVTLDLCRQHAHTVLQGPSEKLQTAENTTTENKTVVEVLGFLAQNFGDKR